jgi:hypothetical protein
MALTLVLASAIGCRSVQRSVGLAGDEGSSTTSVFGRWVLGTPADSTGFAGASQVQLTLSPGTFALNATYPGRPALAVSGSASIADGGLLTLVPDAGSTGATAIGMPPGQPLTRLASASGNTLVLAPPNSQVPIPSSVWHRLDAARAAGQVP